jgi:hypothetical protein
MIQAWKTQLGRRMVGTHGLLPGFARVHVFECVLYRASVPVPVLDEKFYYT